MGLNLTPKQTLEEWDRFTTQRYAMQRRGDYYLGDQAILHKPGKRHDGKAYNKVAMNWIDVLISRHVGFLTGRPFNVTVAVDTAQDEAIENYDALRDECDLDALDSELFRDSLVFGYGVELHSVGDEAEVLIERFDPREWVFLLDENDDEVGAIRRLILPPGSVYEGEVLDREVVLWWTYDDAEIVTYREDRPVAQRSSLVGLPIVASAATMVDASGMRETGRYRHAYGMVPVFRWTVTPDYRAFVTDNIIGLQDAYNKAFSEHLDDVDTDIDALLAINGAAPGEFSRVDPSTGKNQLEALREQGVIVFPDGETRAEFLTRNLPTEKIEYTIKTIRRLIHTAGAVPDLDEMVGATGATSGIALQLQFQAMIERAMGWSKYVRMSLENRVRRLNRIWGIRNMPTLEDYDVKVTYEVPTNEIEIWQNIGALEPLLSRLDMARLVPSIEDPQAAIEAKEAEVATAAVGPQAAPGAVTAKANTLAEAAPTREAVIDTTAADVEAVLAGALADQGEMVSPQAMRRVVEQLAALMG